MTATSASGLAPEVVLDGLRQRGARELPRSVAAVVVGGGVIGLATARELAVRGVEVAVLERGRIGCGASLGNTGLVPPSHSMPLNSPAAIRKALRWTLDPESPFYVRPRLDPALLRFLLRFALASRSRRIPAAVRAMRDLNLLSLGRLEATLAELDPVPFRRDGVLNVYRSPAGFAGGRREAELLGEYGLPSRALGAEEMRAEEPLLRAPLAGGVLWPQDCSVDPELLVAALAADLERRGVVVHEGVDVHELAAAGEATAVATSAGTVRAETVVLAAGSWSAKLAASVSAALPLQPAKGYSLTIAEPAAMPRRPLLLSEAKVAVAPFAGRLRLAGTLELSGYDLKLSRRRLAAVARAGESYLGELGGSSRQGWSGLRALSGDGLPIIGPLPGHRSVLVGTGHGHVGIGMAAGTAQLLAALATGAEPPIDPRPYSPRRFQPLARRWAGRPRRGS